MVEIIAHRGARSLAPENTLAAATLGHALGAHKWETDVSLTRDHRLVIFHDHVLGRCTNAPEVFGYDPKAPEGRDRLDHYTCDQVKQLDAGSYFEISDPFGTVKTIDPGALAGFKGEPVPSLYEGLELTRELNWQINVELKDHGNDPRPFYTASQTLAEIDRAGIAHETVVISSFNHDWLRWVRTQAPQFEIQALLGDRDDHPLDFSDPAFHTDEFPVLNLNAKLITPEKIHDLVSRGKRINLFTVNDVDAGKAFMDAGAQGIITDFPQWFVTI